MNLTHKKKKSLKNKKLLQKIKGKKNKTQKNKSLLLSKGGTDGEWVKPKHWRIGFGLVDW
jgi:hypothetical protein